MGWFVVGMYWFDWVFVFGLVGALYEVINVCIECVFMFLYLCVSVSLDGVWFECVVCDVCAYLLFQYLGFVVVHDVFVGEDGDLYVVFECFDGEMFVSYVVVCG